MKPFDPNCKPGAELRIVGMAEPYYFVGMTRKGLIAYETEGGHIYPPISKEQVSMAPRKVVKYAAKHKEVVDFFHCKLFDTEAEARHAIGVSSCLTVARIEWEE